MLHAWSLQGASRTAEHDYKYQLLQSNSHVTVHRRLGREAGKIRFHDVIEANVADVPCQLQNSPARGDMGHAAASHMWQQERKLGAETLARYGGCQGVWGCLCPTARDFVLTPTADISQLQHALHAWI